MAAVATRAEKSVAEATMLEEVESTCSPTRTAAEKRRDSRRKVAALKQQSVTANRPNDIETKNEEFSAKLDALTGKFEDSFKVLERHLDSSESALRDLMRQRDKARRQCDVARLQALIYHGKNMQYRRELGYSSNSDDNRTSEDDSNENESDDDYVDSEDEEEEGEQSVIENDVSSDASDDMGASEVSEPASLPAKPNEEDEIQVYYPNVRDGFPGLGYITYGEASVLRAVSRKHAKLVLECRIRHGIRAPN